MPGSAAHKRILAIDAQPNFLLSLEKIILSAFPEYQFDKATSFDNGRQLILMLNYDLVILDILNRPGHDLVDLLMHRGYPVLALSNNGASPGSLNQSTGLKIRAVSPKGERGEIVPAVKKALKPGLAGRSQLLLGKMSDLISQVFMKFIPKHINQLPLRNDEERLYY